MPPFHFHPLLSIFIHCQSTFIHSGTNKVRNSGPVPGPIGSNRSWYVYGSGIPDLNGPTASIFIQVIPTQWVVPTHHEPICIKMLRKSNNLSVSLSVRIVAYHVVTTRQLWQPGECVIQASVTNTMTMVYFFTLTTEPECDEVKWGGVWRPKCFFLVLGCMEAAMLEKVWLQQFSSKNISRWSKWNANWNDKNPKQMLWCWLEMRMGRWSWWREEIWIANAMRLIEDEGVWSERIRRLTPSKE